MVIKTTIGLRNETKVFAVYVATSKGNISRIISQDWNDYPWCISNEHRLEYQARKTPGKIIQWGMEREKVIEANLKYESEHPCKKPPLSSSPSATSLSPDSSLLSGRDVLGQ